MGKASRREKQQTQKVHLRETPAPFLTVLLTQPWTVLLLLSLLAILIYSNTFYASFQFDDLVDIAGNPRIRNFSSLLVSGSRYMGFLSFALNYYFGGLNVFGYHLVNLAIHISNSFLVYTLILILFKTPRIQSSSLSPDRSFWIALAAALLFAVHPVQTQAVTYIVQRYTSLATLFYLLAVVSYLKWRLAPSEGRNRYPLYAGALLCTVLAMKTKEIAFTLPLMLLLVEAVFFGSLTRKRWMALVPFLLTLPIIPLSHFPEIFGGNADIIARMTTKISRVDYLLTQFSVIVTYLRLLILPVLQNFDYDYPVYHSLFEPKVIFSFIFLSALLALAFYLLFSSQRSVRPYLKLIGFGLLWFFLTLSIESSIIPIEDVIFEHRVYLPSVGFWLAASVFVLGLWDRWWGMNAIAIGVVVAIFSVATYQRNLIWKDELSFWRDIVLKSPNKERGYTGLGSAYAHLGRLDEAVREYNTSIALNANYVMPHYNLGLVYEDLGRIDEAIREYKTALALKPDYAEVHNNLGRVYKDLGRLEEAVQEFQIVLKLKPNFVHAHYSLGQAYHRMGRIQEAIREYEQALQIEPDYDPARQALKSLRQ